MQQQRKQMEDPLADSTVTEYLWGEREELREATQELVRLGVVYENPLWSIKVTGRKSVVHEMKKKYNMPPGCVNQKDSDEPSDTKLVQTTLTFYNGGPTNKALQIRIHDTDDRIRYMLSNDTGPIDLEFFVVYKDTTVVGFKNLKPCKSVMSVKVEAENFGSSDNNTFVEKKAIEAVKGGWRDFCVMEDETF